MEDRMSYEDVKEANIYEYEHCISHLNMSFEQVMYYIIDGAVNTLYRNDLDVAMVYISLAKFGIEKNILMKNIKKEVRRIIKNNTIDKFKEVLTVEEYEEIRRDLEFIKKTSL